MSQFQQKSKQNGVCSLHLSRLLVWCSRNSLAASRIKESLQRKNESFLIEQYLDESSIAVGLREKNKHTYTHKEGRADLFPSVTTASLQLFTYHSQIEMENKEDIAIIA